MEATITEPLERVLNGIEGISFIYFDEHDVLRHRLVQSVIKAYEAHGARNAPQQP